MSVESMVWPALAYESWRDTAITLQLWTQIVGKIRLAQTPWVNHSWHVTLYVTARGLTTSPIPVGNEILEIEFDFIHHRLIGRTSRGAEQELPLRPQSVASFYRKLMEILASLGVAAKIHDMASELPDAVPFSEDEVHASYDATAVHAFWRALVQADRVLKLFRTGFIGKVSPAHFFWGGFDLAVTRFSGRLAPLHPGGIPNLPDAVTREAYSHEVSSAGFWPGNDMFPRAAFYSYAYPEPPGFKTFTVPDGAYYEGTLGEFILPYDTVRQASDPDGLLLDFLMSTYTAAAEAAHWDRAALECDFGIPGRVRSI
jgi:hypothetical protein